MQVSADLTKAGFTVNFLDTVATVNLEGLAVTGVHLTIKGKVPNISPAQFIEITKGAEKNCIISRALSVPITSEATLIS